MSALLLEANLVNCSTGRSAGFHAAQDSPGLLAWHVILIVAQPGRKRDPDASAREPPAFGKIVEDHFGGVFIRDRQLRHFLLESKRQGKSGQNVSVGRP